MATIDFTNDNGEIIETMEIDDEEFARWEEGAELAGETIEEFILNAIKTFTEINKLETTSEEE